MTDTPEQQKTPFELLWNGKPPTCNSCPLYILRDGRGDNDVDGLCARVMPRAHVYGAIDWCGNHPHHAAAIAVAVGRLVEHRVGAQAPSILQPDKRSQFEKWRA